MALPGGKTWEADGVVEDCATIVGASKKREPDAEVTLFLLEALLCLCGSRKGRRVLRNAGCYPVVRDADYHYAPGRDDRDEASTGPSDVLVTTDDAPDVEDLDAEPLTEAERIRKAIARVCADLASMMLRDESAGAPEEEEAADYDEMD